MESGWKRVILSSANFGEICFLTEFPKFPNPNFDSVPTVRIEGQSNKPCLYAYISATFFLTIPEPSVHLSGLSKLSLPEHVVPAVELLQRT